MESTENKTVKEIVQELIGETLVLEQDDHFKKFMSTTCPTEFKSLLKRRIEIWMRQYNPEQINDPFSASFGFPFELHIVEKIGLNHNWKLLSWRSDKGIGRSGANTFPEWNSHPDLLYQYCSEDDNATGFQVGDLVAIECKWTNHKPGETVENCAAKKVVRNHDNFYPVNALKDGASCFFLAIGVGWDVNTSAPETTYLLPASAIRTITAKKIKDYELNGTPEFNKKESLLSNFLQEKEMVNIINDMYERIDSLINDLELPVDENDME